MSDSGSVSSNPRKRSAAAMQRGSKGGGGIRASSASSSTGPKRRQLDTTRQGVRVWLVKVPVSVAEAIKRAQEGEKVGTLTVTRSTDRGGGAEDHRTEAVRLEEALCEKEQVPRDYTLEAPPSEARMPRMYALRADGERGRLAVEGVVSRRTSLLPTASSLDYKAFSKKRQIQHHRKERRLELIRDDWAPQQRALARASGGGGAGGGGQKKSIDLLAPLGPAAPAALGGGGAGAAGGGAATAGGRVRRLDEAGMRTALFRLFEERGAWRLKELVGRLAGQGEAEVRAGLRVIADNQATGDYKGMWVLKPEFARRP